MSAALQQVNPRTHPNTVIDGPVQKTRAKRNRTFLVESRTVPSGLGKLFGGEIGDWEYIGGLPRLKPAQALAAHWVRNSSFFVRGTECRVRRADTKVV